MKNSIKILVGVICLILGGGLLFTITHIIKDNSSRTENTLSQPIVDFPKAKQPGIDILTELEETFPTKSVDSEESFSVLSFEEATALISKYYTYLQNGKLKEAYEMRYKSQIDYVEFQKRYGNIDSITREVLPKNSFDSFSGYLLGVSIKDKDEYMSNTYEVRIEIKDNLLHTLSSKVQEKSDEKVGSTTNAWIEKTDIGEAIYLDGEDGRIIINELIYDTTVDKRIRSGFRNLSLLKNLEILMYEIAGFEAGNLIIYDIVQKKNISLGMATSYGFTEDGLYYYACQPDGMLGGFFRIYALPVWDIIEEKVENIRMCNAYDGVENTISYVLYDDVEVVYDFKEQGIVNQ